MAEALAAWAGQARHDCGGQPTPPERIHLTLAFLGDADSRAAHVLAMGVHLPRCAFRVEEARYWARNRIVWAGPRETPEALARLAAAIGEVRRFATHITLIRKARPPRRLPPLPALNWPVEEFRLVNSAPGRGGPDYEVLGRYALE